MRHLLSPGDLRFRDDFEARRLTPTDFTHREHVRLAYVYLVGNDDGQALSMMRGALLRFLRHHGIDPSRYHETITRAWLLAVRHFIERGPDARSADDFIESNRVLLDSEIMLTHYSADRLFSEEARTVFVEPDLDRIPEYG